MNLAEQPVSLPLDQVRLARDIIRTEAEALSRLSCRLPADLPQAVDLICECNGNVIVTGIGKAGWIAQKTSATMASTGTRSHFLHPSEAMHGDLGRIGPEDVVVIFSNSGETGEVLQILPTLKRLDIPVIAIVATESNSLSQMATLTLAYGKTPEACPLGLAPSTSTTMMLALGDALALVVSRKKGFRPIDFAVYHPGGSLGKKLSRVEDIMRPLNECRVANENCTVRETIVNAQGPVRRSGAVLLTRENGELSGIYTDSDLARLLERGQDHLLDAPVHSVMSTNPKTVRTGSKTTDAVEILSRHNISELPIVDHMKRPVGIIDITDVISLLPAQ